MDKKIFLSVLLSLITLVSTVNTSTSAENVTDTEEITIHDERNEEITYPIETFSENEISLYSNTNLKNYVITADSLSIEQGQCIEFDSNSFTVNGDGSNGAGFYGTILLKNSIDENDIWTVNYSDLYWSIITPERNDTKLSFPISGSIPVGQYSVSVDLTNFAGNTVTGDFNLEISDNANQGMSITSDKNVVGYNEYLVISGDGFTSHGGIMSAYTKTDKKQVFLFPNTQISFCSDMSSGVYEYSVYDDDYMNCFSKALTITLKSYKEEPIYKNGLVEIYGSSSTERVYNGLIELDNLVYDDIALMKLIDKNTNSTSPFSAIYSSIGDAEKGYSGINITSADSRLSAGDYLGYLLAGDTVYGPVEIKLYDYGLSDMYYTTLNKTLSIYYRNIKRDASFDYDFTVNISITSDDGEKICEYNKIKPSFRSGDQDNAYFKIDLPEAVSVPRNGAYILHTEINFDNGEIKVLDDRHIYIGEYEISEDIYCSTHEYITPKTTEIGVSVFFGNYIQNPDDFTVLLKNEQGDAVAASKQGFYRSFNKNSTNVMYIIPIGTPMEAGSYNLSLVYNGERELAGTTNRDIECRDEPIIIMSTANEIDNKYCFKIENLSEGIYNTYCDWSSETPNGVLSVNSHGDAELILNEEFENNNYIFIQFYIQLDDENRQSLYFDIDKDLAEPTAPYISSVNPGYIPLNATNLKGFGFSVVNKYALEESDILSVKLLSDDTVIAEGTNIVFYNYSSETFNSITYMKPYFQVDFDNIDNNLLNNKNVKLQVVSSAGSMSYDIPVLDDNESGASATISLTNVSNMYGENNTSSERSNYVVSTKGIAFEISGINKTEGEVFIQEYNENSSVYENKSSIRLSDMDKKFTNSYVYSGTFSDELINDKFYRIRYEDKYSPVFMAIDNDVCINTFSKKLDVGADIQQTWLYTLTAFDDNTELSAFYINGSNEIVNVPVSIERMTNNNRNIYATFDFSGISEFITMDLHLAVNGEESKDVLKMNDCRNRSEVTAIYPGYNNKKAVLYMYGYNIGKLEPTLRIWRIYNYNGYDLFLTQPIKSLNLDIDDSASSYYVNLTDLNLSAGKYVYALYTNDNVIGYSQSFYIGEDADKQENIILSKKDLSEDKITLNIENLGESDIKNASLIVASYSNNTLLNANIIPVNILSKSSSGDIIFDTVKNAEIYKIFLWDSLNNMEPLLKTVNTIVP